MEEAEEFVHVYADAAAVAAGRLDEGLDGEVAEETLLVAQCAGVGISTIGEFFVGAIIVADGLFIGLYDGVQREGEGVAFGGAGRGYNGYIYTGGFFPLVYCFAGARDGDGGGGEYAGGGEVARIGEHGVAVFDDAADALGEDFEREWLYGDAVVVAEVGVWGVGCVGRRGRGPLGIGRRFFALLYFFESAFECFHGRERMIMS